MEKTAALKISNLEKVYASGTKALKGVDLEVKKGDFYALLGANGAGKTTLIGIVTGTVNKTAGKVWVQNWDIDTKHDEAKKLIGVVPQEFNFNIFEKVIDILVQQAGFFGLNRKLALVRAEEILKALELWEKRNQKAMTLSGGMKRRLMIARALIHHPQILILDEPTAGVDVELRRGMWEYLRKLNQNGTTIILTTHYLEEVEELCEHVSIIKDGLVYKTDTVRNLIKSLDTKTYLVSVNTLKGLDLSETKVRVINDNTVEIDVDIDSNLQRVIEQLVEMGLEIEDIKPKGNRLEQLFLNILKS